MYSMVGTMGPIAVDVDLPGQKPCCSELYTPGINLLRRSTNIRLIIRYQIEVTDMGLSALGSPVSRPGLGIAVSSVVSNTSSHSPVTTKFHNIFYIIPASSSYWSNNLIADTSIPYTPTAVYGLIPPTASTSSLIVNSEVNHSQSYAPNYTKS